MEKIIDFSGQRKSEIPRHEVFDGGLDRVRLEIPNQGAFTLQAGTQSIDLICELKSAGQGSATIMSVATYREHGFARIDYAEEFIRAARSARHNFAIERFRSFYRPKEKGAPLTSNFCSPRSFFGGQLEYMHVHKERASDDTGYQSADIVVMLHRAAAFKSGALMPSPMRMLHFSFCIGMAYGVSYDYPLFVHYPENEQLRYHHFYYDETILARAHRFGPNRQFK